MIIVPTVQYPYRLYEEANLRLFIRYHHKKLPKALGGFRINRE